MKPLKLARSICVAGALSSVCCANAISQENNKAQTQPVPLATSVVTLSQAQMEQLSGSVFYQYFAGQTYGTEDTLVGVAVIEPGQEIHPPHQHAEEEFLMVIEGAGIWTLNDETFTAQAGDILYAAPWDLHGVLNSGDKPLKFVVFKWNNKGVAAPAEP
ncbi:cupin domain-containing protein [Alteromonas aestuariivivens]|uniref:Cupin domain-containing protein n=1 Tax=Alteromonas aestuariivivens TaxID=1938339 RepID=A0A3D8M9F4_9ALTE|nr:cupin domain-containing protein [Alteromonas aestuariivivens]RDV26606.1 cupin domain-containing protein [Alteromonas aestuariivivens]